MRLLALPTTSPTRAAAGRRASPSARRLAVPPQGTRRPGSEASRPIAVGEPANTHEIFVALGATIREKARYRCSRICSAPFVRTSRSRDIDQAEVMDYCRRSANPVGRLVLRIAGYRDPKLDRWSDAICTALQLTNFWQDLKIDFDRGRLYVPEDEQRAHGAAAADLAGRSLTPAWARVMAVAVSRTRVRFHEGRPLCDAVRGRLGYELRATWLGGTRILDRVERRRGDMIRGRPSRCGGRPMVCMANVVVAGGPACSRRSAHPEGKSGMSRNTSFYFRSSCCRHEKRRAIIAVWDFCRAGRCGRRSCAGTRVGRRADRRGTARAAVQVASWRSELDAAYRGTPHTSQGLALQPFVGEFNLPRARFEELIDGVEMDLSHARYETFDAPRILPAGRVSSRFDLRRDLRLPRSRQPRLCGESRHRAAADQHHPRRTRRSASGSHLPAERGHAPVWCERGRPAARTRDS